MKLGDMERGETATVVRVTGSGQVRKRILDLGLTRGAKVTLVRKAPLGDPIEIELRGYRLTLREGEASIVELEKDTDDKAEAAV
ncbi:MAG: FeoA family protein [Methanomethylophilus sp.]|jgi:ferrous iron transport protein A